MTTDHDDPGLSRQHSDAVVRLGADRFPVEAQSAPDPDKTLPTLRHDPEITRPHPERHPDGNAPTFPKVPVSNVDRPAPAARPHAVDTPTAGPPPMPESQTNPHHPPTAAPAADRTRTTTARHAPRALPPRQGNTP